MATAIQKNIGAPYTISNIQKTRKIISVAMVIDAAGLYSVHISYQENDTDGGGVTIASTSATKVIPDGTLNTTAKNEIDSVYSRALNVI